MINLDDQESVLRIQGGDAVVRSIDALPEQLTQSFGESSALEWPVPYRDAKHIVVCGMGGSRFPSLIIQHLFKKQLRVPYFINDDYSIPAWANKDTLLILSSYSGTTEEVVHCANTAGAQGITMLTGVTAGGDIAEILQKNKLPGYVFDPAQNPSGQPRIGFGYAVGGHLGILIKLGYIDVKKEVIETAIKNLPSLLTPYRLSTPRAHNSTKQLAEKLYEKYPYYIVSEFLTGVGNALANQTNETAKTISSFRVIPELNHHLMEGLKHPEELRKIAMFVFFNSALYSSPIQKRFSITKKVVEQNNIQTISHTLQGGTEIEQAFELMGLGSYLSMYLSALYEENPTAIPYVDYFKQKLKE